MNCQDRQEQISSFIDGALNPNKQDALFGHLAGCSNCRLFLDTMLRMKESMKKDEIIFPDELDERIFGQLAKQKRLKKQVATTRPARVSFWQRPVIIPMPVTVVAGVFILALAVLLATLIYIQYQFGNSLKTFFASAPQKAVLSYELPEIEVWDHTYQKSLPENDKPIQKPNESKNKNDHLPDSSQFIISMTAIDEPPQFLTLVEPAYPLLAHQYGLGGKVIIKALVDSTGRVVKAGALKSEFNFPAMAQSALAAIRQTRFSPAKRSGVPTSAWIVVTYSFRTDSNQLLKKFYELYI